MSCTCICAAETPPVGSCRVETLNDLIGELSNMYPTFSNSWIIFIIWSYIAHSRSPNMDCYWVGLLVFKGCCLSTRKFQFVAQAPTRFDMFKIGGSSLTGFSDQAGSKHPFRGVEGFAG